MSESSSLGLDTFASGESIFCHLHDTVDWTDLDPNMKLAIVKRAERRFVQDYRYDPRKAEEFAADERRADFQADRPASDETSGVTNDRYIDFRGGAPGGGGDSR